MISIKICPKGTSCKPLSNIMADDKSSFVCVGLHDIKKHDKFRHCFKSKESDSMYDYDEYDLISVISVMSETLLLKELKK